MSRAREDAGHPDPLTGAHPPTREHHSTGTGVPRLVINPRQDAGFVEACALAMATAPPVPRALQEALRGDYPRTTVEARALSGEPLRVWYVYRDGHWVSS